MNERQEAIQNRAKTFLSSRAIGIIGVSEKSNKFGNTIYKELRNNNINIYQIHSSAMTLNGDQCYKSLEDVPEKIEALIINVKASKVLEIVKENYDKGVKHFWIQQGSQSKEVIEFCDENNIDAVIGKCVLMFAEPVSSVHKFHKVLWKWFG